MSEHYVIIAIGLAGLAISIVILIFILWYRPKIDRHLELTHPMPPVEELRNAIEDSADETAAIVREESELTRTAIDASTEETRLAHDKMGSQLKTVAGRTQWLVANELADKVDELKGSKPNPHTEEPP